MKKQQKKIQITLISIGLLLIIATYFYYPHITKIKRAEDQAVQKGLDQAIDSSLGTSFENVEYKGLYDLNKPFTVTSEKAHMLDEEPDVMYMTNMHVTLYLSDERIVHIRSNKGKYNKVNYDCFFEDNVKVTDGETEVFAENLNLLASKDTASIYNSVSITNDKGDLVLIK